MAFFADLKQSWKTDKRWRLFLIVGFISMALDQITKIWARHSLPTDPNGNGIPVNVINNYWDWQLSENPGSAFGLFGSNPEIARIFLSVVGVIACGAIVWMVLQAKDDQRRLVVALGLVIGGAVGNLIDRIAFGVVTDFVVWRYHDSRWPTFNIADVALVIGVGLLFLDIGKLEENSDSGKGEKGDPAAKKKPSAGKKPKKKKK